MPANNDRPDDGFDSSAPETSTRRLREQSQLDFELDFLGRVLERDPLYADVLRVHANNLAARGFLNKALQTDLQLARLRPDKPIPWYNVACDYALLGMTDLAFEALERALRLGYPQIHHMRRDPDLKSLRRDPRFQRLLRRH